MLLKIKVDAKQKNSIYYMFKYFFKRNSRTVNFSSHAIDHNLQATICSTLLSDEWKHINFWIYEVKQTHNFTKIEEGKEEKNIILTMRHGVVLSAGK